MIVLSMISNSQLVFQFVFKIGVNMIARNGHCSTNRSAALAIFYIIRGEAIILPGS